jgi:cell division protein FtsL
MKNIFIILMVALFVFITFSLLQKSIFLSQQKKMAELDQTLETYEEVLKEVQIEVSNLSNETWIIKLAQGKLGMQFPGSDDIICVQRYAVSPGKYNYSFLDFLSPEALARDR